MIVRYPYSTLGTTDHGWLRARYHFSFSNYYNPQRTGFGKLLVINDDLIAPSSGFGMHAHDNMEIITYVRSGAITHKDSLGNTGRTAAGEVQVMSAGTGVRHSEFNAEHETTSLYQIWIMPDRQNVVPRWEMKKFPQNEISSGQLPLLVSGAQEDSATGALFIHQDARISGGIIRAGATVEHAIKHQAYLLVSRGSVDVGSTTLHQGDGAEISGVQSVSVYAQDKAEILIIDVPA